MTKIRKSKKNKKKNWWTFLLKFGQNVLVKYIQIIYHHVNVRKK